MVDSGREVMDSGITENSFRKIFDQLMLQLDQGTNSEVALKLLRQQADYAALNPERKDLMQIITTVVNKEAAAPERIEAAMHLSDAPVHYKDALVEKFLSEKFTGISKDANIGNDVKTIKAIQHALNGLQVAGSTLHIEESGIATDRLAGLLRQPEVMAAMREAVKTGAVHDISFNDNPSQMQASHATARTHERNHGRA